MKNITVIIIYLLISMVFSITIWILLYRNSKKNEKELKKHWRFFEESVQNNNHAEILALGEKIVWNNTLTNELLEVLSSEVDRRVVTDANFLYLKEEIRKKKLIRYNKYVLPE
jgi:hypothetical protein